MESEKKLETMEEEIKLMKGELKQSLASVRDYLLNMELPTSEFSTILAALGGDGTQKVTIDGSLANALGNKAAEAIAEGTEGVETTEETFEDESDMPSEDDDLLDVEEPLGEESETLEDGGSMEHEGEITPEGSLLSPEDALEDEAFAEPEELGELGEPDEIDEQDETETPEPEEYLEEEPETLKEEPETLKEEPEFLEEEPEMEYEKTTAELRQSTPKVNLLANLINWVAKAKKEIGYEQMPTFLEVYGISGHLSPELKEVIMYLSEITSEQLEDASNAEIWSQSMLSLHGILTGGDAPLHPVKPFWPDTSSEVQPSDEEIIEVDKSKDMPAKLKLVFPDGDGKSKEFCIDLTPEADSNGSSDTPDK